MSRWSNECTVANNYYENNTKHIMFLSADWPLHPPQCRHWEVSHFPPCTLSLLSFPLSPPSFLLPFPFFPSFPLETHSTTRSYAARSMLQAVTPLQVGLRFLSPQEGLSGCPLLHWLMPEVQPPQHKSRPPAPEPPSCYCLETQ